VTTEDGVGSTSPTVPRQQVQSRESSPVSHLRVASSPRIRRCPQSRRKTRTLCLRWSRNTISVTLIPRYRLTSCPHRCSQTATVSSAIRRHVNVADRARPARSRRNSRFREAHARHSRADRVVVLKYTGASPSTSGMLGAFEDATAPRSTSSPAGQTDLQMRSPYENGPRGHTRRPGLDRRSPIKFGSQVVFGQTGSCTDRRCFRCADDSQDREPLPELLTLFARAL
jgi:hypothetical protein